MERALSSYVKTPILLKPNISNYSSIHREHRVAIPINRKFVGSFKCSKGDTAGWELERKLQKEMNMEEDIVGNWKENCFRESGGVVELMECLEGEAIMGEDEGKEAADYNRRAQIFDRSSRVFKALKESTDDSSF